MKIAVTSASGKLGSTIIKNLVTNINKDSIVGIARTPEKAKPLGVEIRKGDYNSREQFNLALKGVDVVLLISGMDAPDKRIQQHRNVIDAAKQNGVKKIVYTSVVGNKNNNKFSQIVKSNRQTEKDIKMSGLEWSIGRNGLYIEPDLEYIDTYIKEQGIVNCANDGKTSYTCREELAFAYWKLLTDDKHNGKTYNLVGEPITQSQLADSINNVYGTKLKFKSVSVEKYIEERKVALGDFLGTIIGGIYESVRNGDFNVISDFDKIVGRPHKSIIQIITDFKNNIV